MFDILSLYNNNNNDNNNNVMVALLYVGGTYYVGIMYDCYYNDI